MKPMAFDTETYLINQNGKASTNIIPRLVCVSFCDDEQEGLVDRRTGVDMYLRWLDEGRMLIGLNLAFDLAVMHRAVMEEYPTLDEAAVFAKTFYCVKYDLGVAAKLLDIAIGGMFLRGRYGLAALVKRFLGVEMGGKSGPDVWRLRYNELDGVPIEDWPEAASEYALDDARLTWQLFNKVKDQSNPNEGGIALRSHYDFCLHLMSAWGLMVDQTWAGGLTHYYMRQLEDAQKILVEAEIIVDGTKKQAAVQALVESAWKSVGEPPVLTPAGKIKTDAKTLKDLESKGVTEPLFKTYSLFNRAQKFMATYLEPLSGATRFPLCPRYNVIVNSGRTSSCIAKGTPIATLGSLGAGKPIEEVVAGDHVWSFDDEGLPCIKEVSWAGKTGVRDVVRLGFRTQGRRSKIVYLDCTPEHLIRRIDGEWVAAEDLEIGQNVMAVSRSMKAGYVTAYTTGGFEFREHKFAYEQLTGETPQAVHHVDHCKTNNVFSNLQGMTRSEHTAHHSKDTPASQADSLKRWKASATEEELEAAKSFGPDCPQWLGLTYRQIMEGLLKWAGRPALYAKSEGIDYETLQKYMRLLGIDFKDVSFFFNGHNEYMSEDFVARGRELKGTQPERLKTLGVGFYRWKQIQEEYGFVPHNHTLVSLEHLEEAVDVYDLHVPGTHCFIANEIAVHNSGPNVQNFPSRRSDKDSATMVDWAAEGYEASDEEEADLIRVLTGYVTGPDIRGAFVPRPGCVFVGADYSALELATFAQVYANLHGRVGTMGEAINQGIDLHTYMAAQMDRVPYAEMKRLVDAGDARAKGKRQVAKCFHPDTEVLTSNGWVRVGEVKAGMSIVAADVHNAPSAEGVVLKYSPVRFTTERQADTLVWVEGQDAHFAVTPDHRLPMWTRQGVFSPLEASDLIDNGKDRMLACAGMLDEGYPRIMFNEWHLRLLVFIQADASRSCRKWRTSFTKKRKATRLLMLLDKAGLRRDKDFTLKIHEMNGLEAYTFSIEADSVQYPELLTDKVFDWSMMLLPLSWRKIIVDEARHWDGSIIPGGRSFKFSSSIKQNVDVLTALASSTGHKVSKITVNESVGRENVRTNYSITIKDRAASRTAGYKVEEREYNGPVYCLNVDEDAILIRFNGATTILHQCANFGFPGGASAKTFVEFAAGMGVKVDLATAESVKVIWEETWTEVRPHFLHVARSESYSGNFHVQQHGPGRQTRGWRLRVTDSYTAASNTLFQGLAADGALYAVAQVVEACYCKPESPLYGSRLLLFIHDELVIESPEEKAQGAAQELSRLMVEAMQVFTPDIKIEAEPEIMVDRWRK